MKTNWTAYLLSLCLALAVTGNILIFSASSLAALRIAPLRALATLPIVLQYASAALVSLPASFLMSRFGRRVVFAGALALCGLGAVVSAWALLLGEFWLFNIGALLLGFLGGVAPYYRFAAIDAATPAAKAKAISAVLAGGVLAALAGPTLAKVSKDWLEPQFMGTFLALGFLPLVSLVLLLGVRIPKPEPLSEAGRSMKEIMAQPRFRLAVTAAVLSYAVMSLLMVDTPLAMSDCQIGFGSISSVIQWHVLGMFVPSFFTSHLIRRFGVNRVLSLGGWCYLGAIGVNLFGQELWNFWAGLLLVGLGWNFLYLGATDLLTETYLPQEKAKVQGFNETLILCTIAGVSLGSGLLFAAVGWVGVNLVALGLVLTVLSLIYWLQKQPVQA
ncbi:MAG: hypothetical protein A2600_08530 [Candidatus Lambdaproteobacteria bacterium RIFOXYD1_FULL_56_27]|uniref:Major facilitator superfamily (MFS) profile domain-containing protein n=1 Tax=Candidatus Lambdaproteobacteria bacterium RIFOXYD2_FULL_56_26 TaxID=1817773 RepID=A0A1F6GMA4_9PROT|nr:MAG: hypothetical protein A2557_10270 [Candidatus Lambdaproteobacteria bacterium RIFOXYD2_FULL_56_26]OGH01789.1 MAG: hypothetical protein A2426_14185 [Candidatus Lambdaproteobacteria bacterium RIFOXYC1_FULL_56_13]OGH07939.1 MAG: hypothetical protein A2600_08530 [Candidatus Lambdaproteobacteria bacterium RIFOXYD1_FULL_56_27]